MIYPSIDLMDGKAVQLLGGDPQNVKVSVDDIWGQAEFLSQLGNINVIDLDAALNRGNNKTLIKDLAQSYTIRVGGGIRSVEQAKEYIDAGVSKIIIGSKVFSNDGVDEDFLADLLAAIGKKQIIIALDSRDGMVVVKGWTEQTSIKAQDVIKLLEPYCSEFLYTCVEKEGKMAGTDTKTLAALNKCTNNTIIAAGGISTLREIEILLNKNLGVVLGMALYTKKLDINDLIQLTRRHNNAC